MGKEVLHHVRCQLLHTLFSLSSTIDSNPHDCHREGVYYVRIDFYDDVNSYHTSASLNHKRWETEFKICFL